MKSMKLDRGSKRLYIVLSGFILCWAVLGEMFFLWKPWIYWKEKDIFILWIICNVGFWSLRWAIAGFQKDKVESDPIEEEKIPAQFDEHVFSAKSGPVVNGHRR